MNSPKIAIIIPVYKANKQWLNETVNSVYSQTYKKFHIFIVSDNCPYKSEEALNIDYDEKITVLRNNINLRAAGTRNAIIKKLDESFDYICFVDQDDVWENNKLEYQIAEMTKFTNCVCVHTDIEIIDDNSRVVANKANKENSYRLKVSHKKKLSSELFKRNFIRLSSTMVSRVEFLSIGGFDSNLFGGEDWDFWVRLSEKGEFRHLDKKLVRRRVHIGNVSVVSSKERLLSFFKALEKYKHLVSRELYAIKETELSIRLLLINIRENNANEIDKTIKRVKVRNLSSIKQVMIYIIARLKLVLNR